MTTVVSQAVAESTLILTTLTTLNLIALALALALTDIEEWHSSCSTILHENFVLLVGLRL